MFRVVQNQSVAAAKSYYTTGLAREDYYTEGREAEGVWGGIGAGLLGLVGVVAGEAFGALCENVNPASGEALTARTREGRTVGYDLNFHAPKSVSVLHALHPDPRIERAFRSAVRETMQEIEADMRTRVRTGGRQEERVTGNMVWAEFIHRTARPVGGIPDPHLHAHCFTFNATFDHDEARWKAGQFRCIKRDAPYYEAAFHARFAKNLEDSGYAVERTGKGWELAGVPRSAVDKFSRRTQEIEAYAKRLGIEDADAKSALGAKTRAKKHYGFTEAELKEVWTGRLTAHERDALAAASTGGRPSPTPIVSAREAVDYALAHGFERESVVSQKRLWELALERGVGSVAVKDVHAELAGRRVLGRQHEDQRLVTTREVLSEERAMLAFARDGRGACRPLVGESGRALTGSLGEEQRRAAEHVLGSTDRVIAVRGAAGAGKTTMMKETIRAIEHEGKRVFTFAPSAEASRGVLRNEGFRDAETVARFLVDPAKQSAVKGQVIWIDEAGQLGSRTLCQVFEVARRQECRVVLSGDVRQHGAVERGDALRLLESQAGIQPAEIRGIRRQQGAYRDAVRALADGRTAEGFDRLDRMGAIGQHAGASRHDVLAKDYAGALGNGRTALAIAPTHAEGEAVTAAIRSQLRRDGKLSGPERPVSVLRSTQWTAAERSDPARYQAGMVVQFDRPAPGFSRGARLEVAGATADSVLLKGPKGEFTPLPLSLADRFQTYQRHSIPLAAGDAIRITKNGNISKGLHRVHSGGNYKVKGVGEDGRVTLTNGWTIGTDFQHFQHGYCLTSHASQGRTVDCVFIAQGSQSFAATNPQQFYVSASRAREQVRIYTDDKAGLKDAASRGQPRMAATELLGGRDRAAGGPGGLRAFGERLAALGRLAKTYASRQFSMAAARGRPPKQKGVERER